MKLLYVGACYGYPDSGYSACPHGSAARDQGLAWGLQRLGHEVSIVTDFARGPTSEGLMRVRWDVDPAAYDAVVVCGVAGLRGLADSPIRDAVWGHPCVVVQMDDMYPEAAGLGYCRAVGLSSPYHVERYRSAWPNRTAFLLRWGVAEVPEDLPPPWPKDGVRRVLFVGIIYDRSLEALNDLADRLAGVEIWMAGLFTDGSGALCGLSDEERQGRCHPGLHFLSDIQGRSPGFGHGPVAYGPAVWAAMLHADVGLNVLRKPSLNISAKLYDYLGAGLPVVSEDGAPNNGDILAVDGGRIVPFDDMDALTQGVHVELAASRDRPLLRRRSLALGTWTDAARTLLAYLEPAPWRS